MSSVQKTANWSVGGKGFSRTEEYSGEGVTVLDDVQLPAGQAGNATVSGTVVLTSDPVDLEAGELVGVFWEGGQRVLCVIDSVTDDTLVLSGGSGDALPASEAVVVSLMLISRTDIVGDDIQILSLQTGDAGAVVAMRDEADALLAQFDIETSGQAEGWNNKSGITNPLAGDTVGSIAMCASSTTTTSIYLAALVDSIG